MSKKNTGRVSPYGRKLFTLYGPAFHVMRHLDPNERVVKKEQKQVGPKPARGAPPVKLSDETVAAMRWDNEVGRLSWHELAEKYGVTYARVRQLVLYENRAHIKPAPSTTPTGDALPPAVT